MAVARNALFNLFGAALPAVLSVLTIPYVVRSLGAADFGLLTLVTAIVGYFALLDVNLTAGTTKYVAQYHATGESAELNQTISFGLAVYLLIGLLGMAGLLVFADQLVRVVFSVPSDRRASAVVAVQIASVGFLLGQIQAYLHSLPGAMMRYDVSGRIEAAFGSAVPILTVVLLSLGGDLVGVVILRVVMSALQAAVLVVALTKLLPLFSPAWPAPALRAQLIGFSAYSFLSKVASLTYTHADKLLIGRMLGVAAVTFYAVPSTLANRVMGLVTRLSGVMFPHASGLAAAGRIDDLRRHYLLASRYLFFINGAIGLLLAVFAEPLLRLWIGGEFAAQGSLVMALVALGLWTDALTNVPSLVNDGLGHPRVSGTFALLRAVVGLALIYLGVLHFGLVGAAAGHLAASALMSTAFLLYVHQRTIPIALGSVLRGAYLMPILVLAPLVICGWLLAAHATTWLRLVVILLPLCIAGVIAAYFLILDPRQQAQVAQRIWRRTWLQ